MARRGISKNIDQYSEALYRVVKSYPKDTHWSVENLRIALNKFLPNRFLKIWNSTQIGYLMRILKPTKKFKIINNKIHNNVFRYTIKLTKKQNGDKQWTSYHSTKNKKINN